jgi:hypothetical protein
MLLVLQWFGGSGLRLLAWTFLAGFGGDESERLVFLLCFGFVG